MEAEESSVIEDEVERVGGERDLERGHRIEHACKRIRVVAMSTPCEYDRITLISSTHASGFVISQCEHALQIGSCFIVSSMHASEFALSQ